MGTGYTGLHIHLNKRLSKYESQMAMIVSPFLSSLKYTSHAVMMMVVMVVVGNCDWLIKMAKTRRLL